MTGSESLPGFIPGLRSALDYRVPGVDDATTFERMIVDGPGIVFVSPGVWNMPRTPSWGLAQNVEVWVLPGVQLRGGGSWPAPLNGNFVQLEAVGGVLTFAVRVMPPGPQSIPSGVETPLSFGNPQALAHCYDTAGFWTANSPTRITAPVAGVYHLTASLGLAASNAGTRRELLVRVNGADLAIHLTSQAPPSSSTPWLAIGSDDFPLAAGDYVQLFALHDAAVVTPPPGPLNSTPLNVGVVSRSTSLPSGLPTLSGGADVPELSMHYLGALAS